MKNLLASKILGAVAATAILSMAAGTTALAQNAAPGNKQETPKHKEHAKDKKEPAKVEKKAGVHVGDTAPDFTGKDVEGKEHKLSDLTKEGKTVVLVWFNPECPYVQKHFKDGNNTFKKMAEAFKGKDVVVLAVNSGAKGAGGSGVERNAKAAKDWSITFPILLDESGAIGKAYGAKNTPATYVISKTGTLAYMGALDDDNTPKGPGKTNYAIKAVDELLAGKPVTLSETKPYGCGVKYGD